MSDFTITDYAFQQECASIALAAFEDARSEWAEDFDPEADNQSSDLDDRLWQVIDGHEWVIYNYKALMICAHCDMSSGEGSLSDVGFVWDEDSTIYTVATQIVFWEMLERASAALQCLIDEWEPEEDEEEEDDQ